MNVNLNTNVNSISSMVSAALDTEIKAPTGTPTTLLNEDSVTVTTKSTSSDVEKMAELLLAQSNESRKNSLLSHFSSLSAVFENLNIQASEAQKEVLNTLDKESTSLRQAEKDLKTTDAKITANKETVSTKIKEYEAAAKERENAENAVKEAQKELDSAKTDSEKKNAQDKLNKSKETLQAKETAETNAKNAYETAVEEGEKLKTEKQNLETRIEQLSASIVAKTHELDAFTYSVLVAAIRLSAEESQDAVKEYSELEDSTEDKDNVGNAALNERSPVNIIRDALRRESGDLLDSLETRREQHV